MIIADGLNGDVIVNPTEDELIAYQDKRERYFADKKELQKLRDADTVTVDGVHAELAPQILVHLMICQVLLKWCTRYRLI